MQQAYDGLCAGRGTTAVPYFLVKYTEDAVEMALLSDWDVFFKDAKKVRTTFLTFGETECFLYFSECGGGVLMAVCSPDIMGCYPFPR